MRDSRIKQICALIDDARCLVADIMDEAGVSTVDYNNLAAARQFLNSALGYADACDTP